MKNIYHTPVTLVVDLDNSLLKIDLFKETLGRSLLQQPWKFIKAVFWGFSNRAESKIFISKQANVDWSNLPFNHKVIDLITKYRNEGHQVLLATGAPEAYAYNIAKHLGMFDKVLSTENEINNVGTNKLNSIKKEVNGEFIYVGDSRKDLPIWRYCKKAILIGNNKTIQKKLKSDGIEIIDVIKERRSFFKILFRQLRVSQWSKNTLLFIPALASHQLLISGVFINALQGFFAFSLLASSIYIFNDIMDIDYDRIHPKKKNRPIAAGDLSLFSAYGLLAICFTGGTFLAFDLGNLFFLITGIYIVLNLLYSFKLKRVIILDVILLMTFYSIRLVAGQIADSIPFSSWLLSFSIFIFFSLGLLKRFIDINILNEKGLSKIDGRGYQTGDDKILMIMGVCSGLISVLVLMLYTSSQNVQKLYETPIILTAVGPLMLYWIANIWFKAYRGEIIEDPVLYTIKDKTSYLVVFLIFLVTTLSSLQF